MGDWTRQGAVRARPPSQPGPTLDHAARMSASQHYAALDLGTNNCRLLIARPAATGFKVVDSFSRIVRLGEGLGQAGALNPDAVHRTLAALHVCREKIDTRRVARMRLIATEACRAASNGEAFNPPCRRGDGAFPRDCRPGNGSGLGDRRLCGPRRRARGERAAVRHRRGVVRDRVAAGRGTTAYRDLRARRPARPDATLDVAAARGRDAGRAVRRPSGQCRGVRSHGGTMSRRRWPSSSCSRGRKHAVRDSISWGRPAP